MANTELRCGGGKTTCVPRFPSGARVEKAKLEARKKGYAVHEQLLEGGNIKVQILEIV